MAAVVKKRFASAFDGLRSSASVNVRNELEVKETLASNQFTVARVARHGFPHDPRCMVYDPIQKLVAIGTGNGYIRIFGCPGVECHLRHESDAAVIQMQFLINEGALVSACKDDVLHLWNFRQKKPEIVHSLQFQKEQITCIHLPFKSKWLYVGSERGNVHIVSIQNFAVSGYVINWNKAIDLSQKNHPGTVRHLSDCPGDDSKLLIGFDKGTVVLWNLGTRSAEARFQCDQGVKSVSWHPDGKQFVCGHGDGSLSVWNTKAPQKPLQIMTPHARNKTQEGVKDRCRSIGQVCWEGGVEDLLIFSGGLLVDDTGVVPALTILKGTGKAATVLEMEHNILCFLPLSPSPYIHEPFAIAVLLKEDLLIVDLSTPQYPCFDNPYPMDVHESPVTCVSYIADCPTDLIAACYSHGIKKQHQQNSKAQCSPKPWPITGGEWGTSASGNHEMIVTGHADGVLKFWDASSENLQVLYRLKTGRHMERVEDMQAPCDIDLFAICRVFLCPDSRWLVVASRSAYVTLFKFVRKESSQETPVVDIVFANFESTAEGGATVPKEFTRQNSVGSNASSKTDSEHEKFMPLKVRGGAVKRCAGYQPDLVCLLAWSSPVSPETVTALSINSSYGLLAIGTEQGVALVDVVQRVLITGLLTGHIFGVLPEPKPQIVQVDQLPSPSNNDGRSRADTIVLNVIDDLIDGLKHSNDKSKCEGPQRPPRAKDMAKLSRPTQSTASPNSELGGPRNRPNSELGGPLQHVYDLHPPPRPASLNILKDLPTCDPTIKPVKKRATFAPTIQTTSNVYLNRQTSAPHSGDAAFSLSSERGKDSPTSDPGIPDLLVKGTSTFKNVVRRFSSKKLPYKEDNDEPIAPPRRKDKEKPKMGGTANDRTKSQGVSPRFLRRSKLVKAQTLCLGEQESSNHIGAYLSPLPDKDKETCRSRNSSTSSLEPLTMSDPVSKLTFIDLSLSPKEGSNPSLWVGTVVGGCACLTITLPQSSGVWCGDPRLEEPVTASPSGTVLRVKGKVLDVAFLDANFSLLAAPSESWKESSKDGEKPTKNKVVGKGKASPSNSVDLAGADCMFMVVVGETEIRVFGLPSGCMYFNIDCGLAKASVVNVYGSAVVSGVSDRGKATVYSLPSLRLLLDSPFLSSADSKMMHTLCFSHQTQGIYMCSPSEIQKFTYAADMAAQISEASCLLFQGIDMPEPPKQNWIKGIFGQNNQAVDREELFGEKSGKASKSLAKHIPGPSGIDPLRASADTAAGAVSRARLALDERGEKLGAVEDATAHLQDSAKAYSDHAQDLINKYKNKKWYQF